MKSENLPIEIIREGLRPLAELRCNELFKNLLKSVPRSKVLIAGSFIDQSDDAHFGKCANDDVSRSSEFRLLRCERPSVSCFQKKLTQIHQGCRLIAIG